MTVHDTELQRWVDPKLAHGLAREVLRESQRRVEAINKSFMQAKTSNVKARQRALSRMKAALKEAGVLIGFRATADCRHVAYGTLHYETRIPGRTMIAILRGEGEYTKRGALTNENAGTVALVDIHAIARFIERSGGKTLDDFVLTMNPVWGWCRALVARQVNETAMLPLGDGLVAVQMLYNPVDRRLTPRIATVLPGHTLSKYQRIWRAKLEPLAVTAPKFPGLEALSDAERKLADIAWECGNEWRQRCEDRRAWGVSRAA